MASTHNTAATWGTQRHERSVAGAAGGVAVPVCGSAAITFADIAKTARPESTTRPPMGVQRRLVTGRALQEPVSGSQGEYFTSDGRNRTSSSLTSGTGAGPHPAPTSGTPAPIPA